MMHTIRVSKPKASEAFELVEASVPKKRKAHGYLQSAHSLGKVVVLNDVALKEGQQK